jgi:predicted DNA-binding protein (UPF0251 family)
MKRTELDAEGLRAEAEAAVDASPYTQAEIARQLDVSRTSVNRALNQTSPKLEKLRRRILEHLRPVRVERRITYVLHEEEDE